jgi:antirestriction protein ArdC
LGGADCFAWGGRNPRADHAQYFASCLSVPEADKKAIFTVSKASEAAAFLAAFQAA